jgi:hypothetical protein
VLITVDQAATLLGFKSRGSIYRKIRSGDLPTEPGPNDTRLIQREGLEELWGQISRRQTNSAPLPLRPAAVRQAPPEPKPAAPAAPAAPRRPRAADGEVPDYNDERARHEREKRLLAELARQEKERELLRREDVELAWGQAVNITRTRLLGVPSTAKQRIPHLDLEEVELLTALIREALDELAAGEVRA